MKLRSIFAACVALAGAMITGPAFANMVVKDATGATVTVCSNAQAGAQIPCHGLMGLGTDGTYRVIQTDTSGAIIVSNGPTAANQTATQATPGSDASKAQAVQGVTGGKAVTVSGTVSLGGTLPAFATTPTFNVGTMPNVVVSTLPALPAGSNIIGKMSQVDSGGTDATDTTNHAVKVSIVAGALSGSISNGATGVAPTSTNLPVVAYSYIKNASTGNWDPMDNSPVSISATGATSTGFNSTVTTGGTFQSALASNSSRKGCFIQNPLSATEPLYVYFGSTGSGTTGNSLELSPGQFATCATNTGYVLTDNIAVSAATTGHAYKGFSQ